MFICIDEMLILIGVFNERVPTEFYCPIIKTQTMNE